MADGGAGGGIRPQPTPADQFKTPAVAAAPTPVADAAVEYTSLRPRPMSLMRTNSAKSKSEMRAEFQSNAVLFSTPSTLFGGGGGSNVVPLSAALALADHSIDLSLNDSVPARGPSPAMLQLAQPSTATLELAGGRASPEQPLLMPPPPPSMGDDQSKVVHINGRAYMLGEQLGIGGSSVVYDGHLWGMREPKKVAIKVVDLRGDSATVRGYMNETELLAKLQGNASVIGLFD